MIAPSLLPPSLQRWSDWLSWFDHELALGLGAMLLPMHHAIGPFRAPPRPGTDEPNGIDDLLRRGPYDRLLLSEWLLADEIPDEFLRRASGGEHLFLAPRRESVRTEHRILAVFDCGALQLGAPRLAHLALWILLARRAADVGARFEWGFVHAPGNRHDRIDEAGLKQLLDARHFGRATETQRSAWQDALASGQDHDGECWLIGPTMARAPAPDGAFTHAATIERDLQSHLSVSLRTPRQQRRVRVPVPEGDSAQRLLRGAFKLQVVSRELAPCEAPADLRYAPIFSIRGTQVCVLLSGVERAAIYPISKRTNDAFVRPKHIGWGVGKVLQSATIRKYAVAGLICDGTHLYPWRLDGLRPVPMHDPNVPRLPGGDARMPCLYMASGTRPYHFYVIDAGGRLIEWQAEHAHLPQRLNVVADSVLAMARGDDIRLVYACATDGKIQLILRHRTDGSSHIVDYVPVPVGGADRVFLHGGILNRTWSGAWAFPERVNKSDIDATLWHLRLSAPLGSGQVKHETVAVPAGATVVGIARDDASRHYGLVAIGSNGNALLFLRGTERRTLYSSASPIATATAATDCDLIAALTNDGRLIVVTPGGQAPLVLANAEGAST